MENKQPWGREDTYFVVTWSIIMTLLTVSMAASTIHHLFQG